MLGRSAEAGHAGQHVGAILGPLGQDFFQIGHPQLGPGQVQQRRHPGLIPHLRLRGLEQRVELLDGSTFLAPLMACQAIQGDHGFANATLGVGGALGAGKGGFQRFFLNRAQTVVRQPVRRLLRQAASGLKLANRLRQVRGQLRDNIFPAFVHPVAVGAAQVGKKLPAFEYLRIVHFQRIRVVGILGLPGGLPSRLALGHHGLQRKGAHAAAADLRLQLPLAATLEILNLHSMDAGRELHLPGSGLLGVHAVHGNHLLAIHPDGRTIVTGHGEGVAPRLLGLKHPGESHGEIVFAGGHSQVQPLAGAGLGRGQLAEIGQLVPFTLVVVEPDGQRAADARYFLLTQQVIGHFARLVTGQEGGHAPPRTNFMGIRQKS